MSDDATDHSWNERLMWNPKIEAVGQLMAGALTDEYGGDDDLPARTEV
jgi:hypothetical protein